MSFWELPKPTIAAVNGPALAGGFELMLACDLAVASREAVFGEPELKFGAGIVSMLLPWFVGPKLAKGIIFTGEDRIPADEALRHGLVNKVVAPEEVLPASLKLARRLAQMDPMVLQRTKTAVNRSYEIMGMRDALRAALDVDIMIEGEGSTLKREFLEMVRAHGLGKALAWREQRAGGEE
jgi:enoyl-CoA hydratase